MLCGKLPFDGTGAEVARANLLLDPPPIAERVPYLEVDPLLEAFARRLMAKKRDHRPATAKAARELLDLIERDRAAAAAALGVTLTPSGRAVAATAPVAPLRRGSASDTFPPPLPTALDRVDEPPRGLTTTITAPLGDHDQRRARRMPWLLGAGLGLAVAGGLMAFALTRGGGDSPSAPAAPAVERARPEAPTVASLDAAPAQVASPAPGDQAPTPPPVAEPVIDAMTADPRVANRKVKPPRATTIAEQPSTRPTPPPVTTAPTPSPAPPPAPPPPVDPAAREAADRASLSALYRSVGNDLARLGGAASDLWPRYRLVKINEALRSPGQRDEARKLLSQLAREVATLQPR